jgi:hypothetical protein
LHVITCKIQTLALTLARPAFCCNAVRALVLEEIEAGVWLIQSISHVDIIRHPIHFLGKKIKGGSGAKI